MRISLKVGVYWEVYCERGEIGFSVLVDFCFGTLSFDCFV